MIYLGCVLGTVRTPARPHTVTASRLTKRILALGLGTSDSACTVGLCHSRRG